MCVIISLCNKIRNLYQGLFCTGESTAEDDDAKVPPSTTGCRSLPLQTLYQRKKVLKFRERDMKVA